MICALFNDGPSANCLTGGSPVNEQDLLFCEWRSRQRVLNFGVTLSQALQFVSFTPLLLAADRLCCGVCGALPGRSWSLCVCAQCFSPGFVAFQVCHVAGQRRGRERRATCSVYICVCVCVFCGETPQSSCLKITSSPPACPSSPLSLSSFLSIPMKF